MNKGINSQVRGVGPAHIAQMRDRGETSGVSGLDSGRLVAEERGLGALTAGELVYGVPHAKFINASFSYAKPREPMRFNPAERGA